MDFSTKAMGEISTLVAEEIGKHIDADEINKLDDLENGIREVLKKIGHQTYSKVLESEDMKLGTRVRCGCGAKAERISKRTNLAAFRAAASVTLTSASTHRPGSRRSGTDSQRDGSVFQGPRWAGYRGSASSSRAPDAGGREPW